ncbi:MAG TPA: ExbD/TolR family protein [Gemmatimonadaceae bacterium]|jgi:biopolymer transport protein ExbD/biopolymer transport protein TolR|nr:ExbD/TolR family protein [Gemmatimonadaceae bacterium]
MSRRRRRRLELNADINVVNLIDVMLLLLVIFMIAAPMMQGGVDVALPRTDARPVTSTSGMTITVSRDGRISVDEGTPLSYGEFRAAFQTLAKGRTQQGVYIRGDKDAPYGAVAQVLAVVQAAGVTTVGLMTEQEQH